VTYIKLYRHNVDSSDMDSLIASVLEEFYSRAESAGYETPLLVEVHIYKDSTHAFRVLEVEAVDIGVIALGSFIAMHEAWRGWPRIHVGLKELTVLQEGTIRGIILHEAGHSILHGSLKYYLIPLAPIQELVGPEAPLAAWLASTAVKDLEVAKLLVELGYIREAIDYASYSLESSRDVRCRDLIGLLELAKVLAPLIPMPLSSRLELSGFLPRECEAVAGYVIEVLEDVETRRGELEESVERLVRGLLEVSRKLKP